MNKTHDLELSEQKNTNFFTHFSIIKLHILVILIHITYFDE